MKQKRKREGFTGHGMEKMLCNPFYVKGLRVHPKLTAEKSAGAYNQQRFLQLAEELSQRDGSRECVRLFLAHLRDSESNWVGLIPIHASFSEPHDHDGVLTEEQYIRAAMEQMSEHHSVERYFRNVIQNLSQGQIPFAPQEKTR